MKNEDFDYVNYYGERILGIDAELFSKSKKGQWLGYDFITFIVEGRQLEFTVNGDTDEIIVKESVGTPTNLPTKKHQPVLQNLIGREFGWAWFGTNSQGYSDMVILAFGDPDGSSVTPQLAFVGVASEISLYKLEEVTAEWDESGIDD